MRILYHHRIAASDGMRVHVTEVVDALRARGHQVRVVGPTANDAQAQAGASSVLERAAERLRRWLPAAGYEVLELLYNVPAYVRLWRATQAFKPDLIYERNNLFLLAGLWLKRVKGLPLLLEVNSPLAAERARFGGLALRGLARRCEAATWGGADVVLPVTEVLARRVRRVRGGSGGVLVAPNGASVRGPPDAQTAERLRVSLGLEPDALVLGFVGFVRAWHGVGWAVEALSSLPRRSHLLVVGDGPALESLRSRAAAAGVGARVHLVGRVPHDEVAQIMGLFDVALQTAATAYASPLKLFEYMGMGLAILAPDQANIREVLTDGRDALLFPPRSEDGFRSALQRLCNDEALRRRLGAQALSRVRDTPLTWEGNALRIEAVARELAVLRAAGSPHPGPLVANAAARP